MCIVRNPIYKAKPAANVRGRCWRRKVADGVHVFWQGLDGFVRYAEPLRSMMAPAIFIGDLFAAARPRETVIKSLGVNPAVRKSVMDQRYDWAPVSVIAVMVVCATMGQLRLKA